MTGPLIGKGLVLTPEPGEAIHEEALDDLGKRGATSVMTTPGTLVMAYSHAPDTEAPSQTVVLRTLRIEAVR